MHLTFSHFVESPHRQIDIFPIATRDLRPALVCMQHKSQRVIPAAKIEPSNALSIRPKLKQFFVLAPAAYHASNSFGVTLLRTYTCDNHHSCLGRLGLPVYLHDCSLSAFR